MNFNFYSKLAPVNRRTPSTRMLGHLACAITVIMWGFSFISTKKLLEIGMGPVEIYVYRFVIAYLMMLVFFHNRFRTDSWRDEGLFLICSVCGSSLYFIAENTALEYTTSSNVSLLTSLSPLFTVLLTSVFFVGRKVGRSMYLGSAIAVVGVACVIFNSSSSLEVHPIGDMLSLIAAACWAIYNLLILRLSANYDVGFITRRIFFYGIITSLPFLAFSPTLLNPIDVFTNGTALTNMLFLAVGASLLGFMLWSYAIKDLGAISAGNYLYFQPVVTMVAAVFILNEQVTVLGATGCALILGGLIIGEKGKKGK